MCKEAVFCFPDDNGNLFLIKIARLETYQTIELPYEEYRLLPVGRDRPLWFPRLNVQKTLRYAGYLEHNRQTKSESLSDLLQGLYGTFMEKPAGRIYLEFRPVDCVSFENIPANVQWNSDVDGTVTTIYHPIIRILLSSSLKLGTERIIGCYIGYTHGNECYRFSLGLIFGTPGPGPEKLEFVPRLHSRSAFGFEFRYEEYSPGAHFSDFYTVR